MKIIFSVPFGKGAHFSVVYRFVFVQNLMQTPYGDPVTVYLRKCHKHKLKLELDRKTMANDDRQTIRM